MTLPCATVGMLAALAAIGGCSGKPARVYQVDVDPAEVAACLIEQYDEDGSQTLSSSELAKLTCVKRRASAYDANGDKQIDRDELASEIGTEVFNPRKALMSCSCAVTNRGKPLAGATVRFVPLDCLREVLPPATGTTNEFGIATLSLAPDDSPPGAPAKVPLVRPGFYRVEVTHDSQALPARYNAESVLTAEISSATLIEGAIKADLEF